jgi:serine/threonine protein kinase
MNDPRAGKIVGTTDYLSPEQIRTPLEIQPASDIYSLGCTLYYAVCGKVPFPGGDTQSKLRRHLEEFPLHPRNFAPDITEDFVDIIVDMMEKDLGKRITSAAEVAARLEPWADGATSMGGARMSRTPWLAPPPPSHGESPEIAAQEPDEWDTGFSSPTHPGSTDESLAASTLPGNTYYDTNGGLREEASQYPGLPQADTPAVDSHNQQFYRERQAATLSMPAPPPLPASNQLSPGMLIALTIAIVVPPALLLGAILGYIVATK